MFVLGAVGVCCGCVEERAEAAVQRFEADECVEALQGGVVDDREGRPVGREEQSEEVERGPCLVELLVDPDPGGFGCGVAPCPDEGGLRLGEFVDRTACGWGEVPCDLVADQ
ncbi:hypothetical protein OYE22_33385 [Streptomyces sp. 71268]|uniref:hypothetical protein n=1 Tax=Streptomyces sp. 71268 TaxID=3002640 RepID=UPI0023F61A6C|nr:hypothetical protein [Streptomyces sp. 71268]WEV29545.1 hypothetical protein OYE22_33385 [Streptomyces sp. 71268]